MSGTARPLVAFVGSYGSSPVAGGISVLRIERTGASVEMRVTDHVDEPGEAGYLLHAPSTGTLYAVDERKTDGRGPVGPRAAVHAFAVDPDTGALTLRNALAAPGPFPTYLGLDPSRSLLFSANHGSFEHVERVVRTEDGWATEYVYDDSVVVQYRLAADGSLDALVNVHVLDGHGVDPNSSLQAGGHAQSGPHAHSAVVDPSGSWLLVADKGADRILVFRIGAALDLASTFQAEPETGPRHIAFDPMTGRAYATYEFSSELVAFDFDTGTGTLSPVSRCSTLAGPIDRTNEPADVRVHPAGRLVYVNNRGEDSLAWFAVDDHGGLARIGDVRLAVSLHPGVAARSVAIDPSGTLLLVTDRPDGLIRAYSVGTGGKLTPVATVAVAEPAFVTFAQVG